MGSASCEVAWVTHCEPSISMQPPVSTNSWVFRDQWYPLPQLLLSMHQPSASYYTGELMRFEKLAPICTLLCILTERHVDHEQPLTCPVSRGMENSLRS